MGSCQRSLLLCVLSSPQPADSGYAVYARYRCAQRATISMKGPAVPIIIMILVGMLNAACALFSEKDVNIRAGKARIQDGAASPDGVQIVLQKGHSNMIQAVVLSRNGRMVMTGSEDETARLWDVSSGQMVRSFVGGTIHGPHALAFGPEGQVVIGDRRAVGVYDATTGREIRSINVRDSERFVVSPDGRVLATAGGTVATKIELWDLTTGLELSQDPAGSLALPLAFSPDGRRFVTQRRVAGVHGSVTVWEAATGKKIKTVDHSGEVQTAALSPDGRMLALQAADRTIVVKDVDTSRVLQQFSLAQSQDTGRTTGFRFSPDSRLLATADSENLVRLWDLHKGREFKAYRGTDVDFGDDGKILVRRDHCDRRSGRDDGRPEGAGGDGGRHSQAVGSDHRSDPPFDRGPGGIIHCYQPDRWSARHGGRRRRIGRRLGIHDRAQTTLREAAAGKGRGRPRS